MQNKSVVASLNNQWRVVHNPLQWILQLRKGKPDKKSTGWRDRSFCRHRTALIRCIREYCGPVRTEALAIMQALPDLHQDYSQKENPAVAANNHRAMNHSSQTGSTQQPHRRLTA